MGRATKRHIPQLLPGSAGRSHGGCRPLVPRAVPSVIMTRWAPANQGMNKWARAWLVSCLLVALFLSACDATVPLTPTPSTTFTPTATPTLPPSPSPPATAPPTAAHTPPEASIAVLTPIATVEPAAPSTPIPPLRHHLQDDLPRFPRPMLSLQRRPPQFPRPPLRLTPRHHPCQSSWPRPPLRLRHRPPMSPHLRPRSRPRLRPLCVHLHPDACVYLIQGNSHWSRRR